MLKRKILKIDEDKCDGCGLCIPSCSEGALKIINGKAKLISESYCDGLGACLGECPHGALSIAEMVVEEFDEQAVKNNIASDTHNQSNSNATVIDQYINPEKINPTTYKSSGCPSAKPLEIRYRQDRKSLTESKLGQWPLQLHLVPPFAPFFANADLYLIADCVPFAYPNFHKEFLEGHSIAVACPKLDNTQPYVQKIVNIIKASSIKSITSVVMEVPCCSGLVHIAREAIMQSGADIPFGVIVIGIRGNILQKNAI